MPKDHVEELSAYVGLLARVQYKLIGMLRANGAITHEQTTELLDFLNEEFEDAAELVQAAVDQTADGSTACT